ncbi:MAG: helix-turn-helix transcriptional regulator [Lachnospiraceae bacterium]|nr:helix-turn-helix transcriptional regulator [Lachnospiraceae bacterium]
MVFIKQKIAKIIRDARPRDIIQSEAAKQIGVSIMTLCKWEKGVTLPTLDQFIKMCEIYDKKIDIFEVLNSNDN